jgi:hypothetical protein
MTDRTYARFYYPEFIRDYPHVYADDAALSAWLRLFVTAEAMWPARAELPRSVKTRTLAKLTAYGLIETDGRTYSVKGMDAERSRRRDNARTAAAKRWHSDRNADAHADAMPKRDETSRDKTKGERDGIPVENGRGRPVLVHPGETA